MKISNYQIEPYIQKIAQEKIAGCLLFGPEESVVKYRFDIISKKISPDLSDPFLVTSVSKERLSEDKGILADEFFSYSMLGGRKLILVKDADAACGAALKLLCEDQDFAKKSENFILIQAGDLDKSSALRKIVEDSPYLAAIACYEDDERVIKTFIRDELVKRGLKFNSQIIDFLLEKFGKDRQIILSELEKITVFLGNEKSLTIEVVESLTSSESEISANEFVMSFAAQKFGVALMQSEKLFRDGFEVIALIRFLSNYFQKLYDARILLDSNGSDFESAAKSQKLFFKTEIEFRKHLNLCSQNFLTKILQDLQDLEIKIKSGTLSPSLGFVGFMQKIMVQFKKYKLIGLTT